MRPIHRTRGVIVPPVRYNKAGSPETRSTLIGGAPAMNTTSQVPFNSPRKGSRSRPVVLLGLKGNPTTDKRLTPSHLQRNRRAFGQCPQLRPHDTAVDAAGKRALRETAIGTGHQVVATDALGKAHEPLGHELRMLHDVG